MKKLTPSRLITPFILLLIANCAQLDKTLSGTGAMPSSEDRQVTVRQFPNLTDTERQNFINGVAWIGMSENTLTAMWGNDPFKNETKLTKDGQEKICLYKIRVGDWTTGVVTKFYKVRFINEKVAELSEINADTGSLEKI